VPKFFLLEIISGLEVSREHAVWGFNTIWNKGSHFPFFFEDIFRNNSYGNGFVVGFLTVAGLKLWKNYID